MPLRSSTATARVGYLSVADVPIVVDLSGWPTTGWATPHWSNSSPTDDIHATADYRAQLVRVLTAGVVRSAPGGAAAMSEERTTSPTVNGSAYPVSVPARRLLSDALRHDLGLTGTHVGCEHGSAAPAPSSSTAPDARLPDVRGLRRGHEITTVEGLANADGSLGPVQQAFLECHGLQCGFCTPGS